MKNIFTLLLASCLAFQSCTKEVIQPTQAEIISNQLTDLISKEKVTRVIYFEGVANYDNTSIIGDFGDDFRFDKQFVTIEGKSWNLNFLKKYEVRTISNIKFLGLYF
jgi:DNA-directed RNA polymerase delta subunit